MMAGAPQAAELAEGKTVRVAVPSDTLTVFVST